jgi:prophage regulatory protein
MLTKKGQVTMNSKSLQSSSYSGRRILSYEDLKSKGIRFSRQWILSLSQRGKFPKAIRLGEASTGFVEDEVDAWIEALIQERDGETV